MKTCTIVAKPARTNVATLTCGYVAKHTCPACDERLCNRHATRPGPRTAPDRHECARCGHQWVDAPSGVAQFPKVSA